MLGIIKRDLIVMLSSKRERIFTIFYIPFLLFVIESYDPKWLYLAILVSYTYLYSLTPFTYDISGNARYIINSLPINRKELVFYKYLSTFIYFLMIIVYAGVYLWIINTIGIKNVDYFNLEMIIKALPIIMISISIVFPAYFRFEPKIAQIIHTIVFLTFFIGITNMSLIGEKSFVKHIVFLQGKNIVFVAILMYIVSLLLSIKLYENRDL
ncbi:TPA: ABC-2 transporter permease [Clostridioides difficile]